MAEGIKVVFAWPDRTTDEALTKAEGRRRADFEAKMKKVLAKEIAQLSPKKKKGEV